MNTIEQILEKQRAWQALSAGDESAVSHSALESLSKCADAIAVLSENLRKIGYIWVSSERIPPDLLKRNIQTIETSIGASIPKVLGVFWQLIGGVSFVDLENYQHVNFWKENRIGTNIEFADGLHIDPCNAEWVSFICNDYLDWKEFSAPGESEGFLLSLSPDGFHKDNISGGAPYGVLAGSTWKPAWKNFKWTGMAQPVTALVDPPDFLSYLRTTILECAGFPALLGEPAFNPVKGKLLERVPLF
jgi:hypothetical protein